MRKNTGFTLLELMIVVSIIGILAAIGLAKYDMVIRRSGEGVTKGNLGVIRSAISVYYGNTEGYYPYDNLECLTVSNRYLAAIPIARTNPYHGDTTVVLAETSVSDTGGWSYDNVNAGLTWGTVHVACLHQDVYGRIWSSF